jgi:phosphoenolpyruvate carboxylase
MTRRTSDLLLVYVLAREAGLTRVLPEGPVCLLPVVPLFETGDDLAAAPAILQAFLEQPFTRRSLDFAASARGGGPTQQVMIGLQRFEQGRRHPCEPMGASAGAGATRATRTRCGRADLLFPWTREAPFRAEPGRRIVFSTRCAHNSLSGNIRLTEQGETIAQKFANIGTAAYNLELLAAGVTANDPCATHARHVRRCPCPDLRRAGRDESPRLPRTAGGRRLPHLLSAGDSDRRAGA